MAKIPSISAEKNKEAVGLAGEYAVASELCKRGYYAQLTLGNHKKTDLLIDHNGKLLRVSVKTKTGATWPKVTGIWEQGDILIFVDFKGKDDNDRPDFYVLGVEQWKSVVKKLQKAKSGNGKIDGTNTLYWDPWEGNDKGWRGCSVSVKVISQYQNCWPDLRP